MKFQLREASEEDIEQIYQWQCHPRTREFSLIQEVPSWEQHKKWMYQKLNSNCDYFYIITDEKSKKNLGVLRLDWMQNDNYLVSIFVSPNYYGCGVATAALRLADKYHPNFTLHATVLKTNIASQKLFEKANYSKVSIEKYIRNPI